MTALVEAVAEKIIGAEAWQAMGLAMRYEFKNSVLPVITALVEVLDSEPHRAKRGSDVEAWIKAARDLHDERVYGPYEALNDLLDDYRLHADTGTALNEEVPDGPQG
jgi:hypothetical protein